MTTMDWVGVVVIVVGIVLVFVVGFSVGRWWEAHWHEDVLDPARKEWRL